MMLNSNAAAGLNPRGLQRPFLGRGRGLDLGRPARMRAYARSGTGWGGRPTISGLGLTDAEITAALVAGAGPGTEAYEARYGAGGSYLREASVIAAYGETSPGSGVANVTEWGQGSQPTPGVSMSTDYVPPALYATEACSPMDSACVERNDQVQQANLAILRNANLAVYMANCLAPGDGRECRQYEQIYVPPVPLMAGGFERPLLPSIGGQAQIAGETAEQQQANAGAWADYQVAQSAQSVQSEQQAASAVTNKPNQSVPPADQPGTVSSGGGITAAELAAALEAQNRPAGAGFSLVDAEGKILGLDPKILMLIAAGVGALVLLKK